MPVDCSVDSLVQEAKCLTCLSPLQLEAVKVYLLCEFINNGGGSSCLLCGVVDPTDTPDCPCALYYNSSTGDFWFWDAALAQWVNFIN